MTDRELAIKYAPHLYFDKNEPFTLDQLGYDIIRTSERSKSFERDIWIDTDKVALVIEYQLYFDFDIQHMYDLEHFWVYVGHDGKVVDGEASAHGSHMNCFQYTRALEEETHIPIYIQPGKHAVFPEGKLFKLFSDVELVCHKYAGTAGLLITKLFQGVLHKNSYLDYQVCSYIRENFSFHPTLEFVPIQVDENIVVTWEELYEIIPVRIERLLKKLGISSV
ncbi:MAG: hypothetical protein K0R46_713 [Herbinix sp.]|nr:hypothetical protein [Herbinix sp.]